MVAASDQEKANRSNESPPAHASDTAVGRFKHLLPSGPPIQITEDHVRSVLNVRRGREVIFGQKLFSDPAWDVILELYASKFADRKMTASELASLIGAPRSIIVRWIATLVESGLIQVNAEGNETQPTFALTDAAAAKMARLVSQWSSAFFAI
jgi:DNA-binding MarR family transcriptional regulator